jgi:hypothetical protein
MILFPTYQKSDIRYLPSTPTSAENDLWHHHIMAFSEQAFYSQSLASRTTRTVQNSSTPFLSSMPKEELYLYILIIITATDPWLPLLISRSDGNVNDRDLHLTYTFASLELSGLFFVNKIPPSLE